METIYTCQLSIPPAPPIDPKGLIVGGTAPLVEVVVPADEVDPLKSRQTRWLLYQLHVLLTCDKELPVEELVVGVVCDVKTKYILSLQIGRERHEHTFGPLITKWSVNPSLTIPVRELSYIILIHSFCVVHVIPCDSKVSSSFNIFPENIKQISPFISSPSFFLIISFSLRDKIIKYM